MQTTGLDDDEQERGLAVLLLDEFNGLPPPVLAPDPVGTCDACAGSVMSIGRKSPSRFTSRAPLGTRRDQSSGPVDRAERSKTPSSTISSWLIGAAL
jgi:hypothetical protein